MFITPPSAYVVPKEKVEAKFPSAEKELSVKGRRLIAAAVLAAAVAIGCSSPADTTPTTTPTTTPAATYTVSYDGNGATSGSAPVDSKTYAAGDSVTVLGNTGKFVKTGCDFVGWNTKADCSGTSYAAGASFSMGGADLTLYAKWASSTGGGSITVVQPSAITIALVAPSTVTYGSAFGATASPSESVDSYVWYLDDEIVQGQTTATFTGGAQLSISPHTLMVVVSKDGSFYSASCAVDVQGAAQ